MLRRILVGLGLVGMLGGCLDEPTEEVPTPPGILEPLKIIDPPVPGKKSEKSRIPSTQTSQVARAPPGNLENVIEPDQLTVYYRTASWRLDANDQTDLRTFVRARSSEARRSVSDSVIVEGHCDERGTTGYNDWLGNQRADGVAGYLSTIGFTGSISKVSYGEGVPVAKGRTPQALSRNRRVVVVRNQHVISRALGLLPATKYYLIDATGSMQGDKWQAVIDHEYVRPVKGVDPRIYAFNSCINFPGEARYLKPFRYKNEVFPGCETPLWDATGGLLDRMASGETLTILSDGEDTSSGTHNPVSLIRAAKAKGIKVSTIGVGVGDSTKQALIDIATQTGGQFYVTN